MSANATVSSVTESARPLVSVVMANHQGAPYIERALRSVMAQSLGDLEIIVVDDASTDGSAPIVERLAGEDARVRLLRLEANGGPARARNAALDCARGRWIAVVDGDDIVHPERFERLVATAGQTGADVVADDLMHFHEDGAPVRFLLGERYRSPFFVSADDLIRSGSGGSPPLGYLKPMFRAERLGALRYDETVRIGEDHDLLLRILLAGASFWVAPVPWYLYRRHGASISHRLAPTDLVAMIENQRRLIATEGAAHPEVLDSLRARLARLERALAFEGLVTAAKQRKPGPVLGALARDPALLAPLGRSVFEHFGRGRASQPAAAGTRARTIELGEGAVQEAGHDEYLEVPGYKPADRRAWDGLWHGALWHRLGNLASGGALKVICNGRGAVYAAGFIPADRIEIVGLRDAGAETMPAALAAPAFAGRAAPAAGPFAK